MDRADSPSCSRSGSTALDDARGRAWAGLTSALAGGDWDFVIHAIGASTRSAFFMLGRRGEGSATTPDHLREPAPGHPSLTHTDVAIPPALVTPRMLWSVFGSGRGRQRPHPPHHAARPRR